MSEVGVEDRYEIDDTWIMDCFRLSHIPIYDIYLTRIARACLQVDVESLQHDEDSLLYELSWPLQRFLNTVSL